MPRGTDRYDEALLQQRLWTPAVDKNKNNLVCWYDAADLSTITIATGVSEWRDKSGFNNHVAQATTTAQPALTMNALNGKPVLTFDGGDFLYKASLAGTGSFNSNSSGQFAVVRYTNFGTGLSPVSPSQSGAANLGAQIQCLSTTSASYLYWGGAQVSVTVPTIATTDWNIHGGETTVTGTSALWVWFNSLSNSASGGGLDSRAQTIMNIGSQSNSGALGTFPHIGDIAEIVTFGLPFSSVPGLLDRVQGYLAWKWGLVSKLSGSHVYKNSPPLISSGLRRRIPGAVQV